MSYYETKTPPTYSTVNSVPYMSSQAVYTSPGGQQVMAAVPQQQMAQVGYPQQMGLAPQFQQQQMGMSPGLAFQAQQLNNCAIGNHTNKTEYGTCGIIVAVVFFPIGLIALMTDKKKICTRCGNISV